MLFGCGWSVPTCPGRSVKIRIAFCFVHEHRRWPRGVFMIHEHRPTGEVELPGRPTERPGYAQTARARPTTTQKRGARAVHRSLIVY